MSTTSKLYTFNELMTEGIVVDTNGDNSRHKITRILIPMIQRPYAQGRKSQEGVRKKFLNDIFYALQNGSVDRLELNFIYGSFTSNEADNNFELLDGQQRLTTLFLLHWYVAALECSNGKRNSMPEYLCRFEYQTRTSSSDFLKKLFSFKIKSDERPSQTIRKAAWYSKSYDKDSTIDGMLRMLDAISEKYSKSTTKPIYGDLDKLKFYVLELNGFGLSEELFIKMNARGLQLTPFENFKADLVGYMKNEYTQPVPMALSNMNRIVPYWLNFSSLMDGKWLNLFWSKPSDENNTGSKECDIRFFRFIQRFFVCKSVLLVDESREVHIGDDNLFGYFYNNIEVERYYSFHKYEEIIVKGKTQNIDISCQLEHILNFLCDENIGGILLDSLTAPWESKRSWQPWSADNEVGLRQTVLVSVLFAYILKIEDPKRFVANDFITWMRFAHNMIQSTDINHVKNMVTMIRLMNEVLNFQQAGNSAFKAWQHPYEAIVGFNDSHRDNRYLEAEAQKAKQILLAPEWESAFRDAEANVFLQGSVTFYFEEDMDISAYRRRTANVLHIFNKDGVVDELAKDYLLIRAVLCRNFDWTGIKKNMTNINITNRGADRHLRNLTIWNTNVEVKRLFCQLLDCTSDKERETLLATVAEEHHELLLRTDGYWTDAARHNLQTLYNRLHSEKEMHVLRWLYWHNEIKMMGVWINGDGTGSLYKGHVNSIMLTSERHKIIPMVLDKYKDKFSFVYADQRQADSLALFGNYSGTDISLFSQRIGFGGTVRLKLTFLAYGSLYMDVIDDAKAIALFERYKRENGGDNISDRYGHDIADSEGKLSFYMDNGEKCNHVNFIPNACSMPLKNLFHIMDVAYEVLSDGNEKN